jgi:excinuclease UvrABC ATPase subunit
MGQDVLASTPYGRCEVRQGDGLIRWKCTSCRTLTYPATCKSKRYNRGETEVKYKGKRASPKYSGHDHYSPGVLRCGGLARKLQTLMDVGLSYITGQCDHPCVWCGGRQRCCRARTSKRDTGKTLYILDEPTTGPVPSPISSNRSTCCTACDHATLWW